VIDRQPGPADAGGNRRLDEIDAKSQRVHEGAPQFNALIGDRLIERAPEKMIEVELLLQQQA
jgi:hypothetical protein